MDINDLYKITWLTDLPQPSPMSRSYFDRYTDNAIVIKFRPYQPTTFYLRTFLANEFVDVSIQAPPNDYYSIIHFAEAAAWHAEQLDSIFKYKKNHSMAQGNLALIFYRNNTMDVVQTSQPTHKPDPNRLRA